MSLQNIEIFPQIIRDVKIWFQFDNYSTTISMKKIIERGITNNMISLQFFYVQVQNCITVTKNFDYNVIIYLVV